MHPELARLFGWRIPGYGLAVLVGLAVAAVLALRRARAMDLPRRELLAAALPALLAAALGARLAFVAQCGGSLFRGGFTLYGGLLAGVAAALAASRGRLRVTDVALPCVFVGVAFGRLGCFLGGCCYGAPAAWGAAYPRGSFAFLDHAARGWIGVDAPGSLPTVPAPLIEALALLALAAGLSRLKDRRPGTVTALAGLGYGAWRFVAEFWRGDHPPYWGPLTFSQGVSLAVILASAALWRRGGVDILRPTRPPSLAQAAGVVALLIAASGALACAYPRERPMEMRGGEIVLRRGCAKKERVDGYRQVKNDLKDEASDCFDSCLEACIEDCVDSCVDSCCEAICDEEDVRDPAAPLPPPSPIALLLEQGRFSAGRLYGGRINLVATINQACPVMLVFQGTVKAVDVPPGRPATVQIDIEAFDFRFDTLTLTGKGTLDARVGSNYQVTVVSSTLPAEILSAMKSVEPLLASGLSLPENVKPDPAIRARLEKELAAEKVELELTGDFDVENHQRRLDAAGQVERLEPGVYRVTWRYR